MTKNLLITAVTLILLLNNVRGYSIEGITIQVLDVGQGDAIVIRTNDDKYILIDGGPGELVMEQLGKAMPFWQKTFDLVVATHGDADHISGLVEVMDRYKVKVFVYNGEQKNNDVFTELMRRADFHNVRVEEANAGKDIQVGCCVNLDLLWPSMKKQNSELVGNDRSIAFIMSYENFDMYFAGDLSFEYEEEMLNMVPRDVEVMKLSHHGSKTSTSKELLELLTPEKAIVSVGKDNTYGHPSNEVLDSIRATGAAIHRTDEEGIITISTNGNSFYVVSEAKRNNWVSRLSGQW